MKKIKKFVIISRKAVSLYFGSYRNTRYDSTICRNADTADCNLRMHENISVRMGALAS
jgi:hypothetical protein